MLIALGTLSYARAQADLVTPEKPAIVLAGEGCPDPELVRQMLAPLVSERIVLAGGPAREGVEARAPARAQNPDVRTVRVRDLGAEYAIEMEGAQRIHSDPERNCAERARVAAVFIALNLRENAASEAAMTGDAKAPALASSARPTTASSQVTERGTAASEMTRWPLHMGLGVWASALFAPGPTKVAPGGGAALWLELSALRLQLSGELMGKVALPLSPREPGGSAELWRVPLAASAGYVWRASRFALEPRLAVAVDLLRLRGRGVNQSERALRANAGVQLGLSGRVFLAARLALFAALSGTWFPRSYELRVEPAPRRAHSPEVWLAGQLGLEFMLR